MKAVYIFLTILSLEFSKVNAQIVCQGVGPPPCSPGTVEGVDQNGNPACCQAPSTTSIVTTGVSGTTISGSVTGTSSRVTQSTSRGSTNCQDLLNPRTGVSDCPKRASLCNDRVYFDVMTQQCPRTCNRCASSSTISTGISSTSARGSCVDLLNPRTGVSDCPQRRNLCNNPLYLDLMTMQCPQTCGRCSGSSSTSRVTTRSSPTASASTSISTSSGACVDRINPSTNVSDCPQSKTLCTDPRYQALMREQCPVTCGFC